MCKIFGMAGVNQTNRGDAINFLKAITPKMTKFEQDGFGYAAINEHGEVFGEKWLRPKDCWSKRIKRKNKPAKEVIPKLDRPLLEKFDGLLSDYKKTWNTPAPCVYDSFGNVDLGSAVAFIAHSRMGTGGGISINNVHPFVAENTALIHNGIVYNHNEPIFYKTQSDCDSEILLNRYNDEIVQMDSRRIQEVLDPVDAYLACMVLTNVVDDDESIYPALDIFKADANLDVVYVHDLELYMFCTDGKLIVDTCKEFGWATSNIASIADENLIRIDAVTGEIAEVTEFTYENTRKGYGGDVELKSRYGANWQDYKTTNSHSKQEYRQGRAYIPKNDSAGQIVDMTESGEYIDEFGDIWEDDTFTPEEISEYIAREEERQSSKKIG